MFENFDWTAIVTIVLGLIATVAGSFWLKAKGKLAQIVNLGKEAVEAAEYFEKILADNKVEKSEVEQAKKELKDVRDAFKVLIGKSV